MTTRILIVEIVHHHRLQKSGNQPIPTPSCKVASTPRLLVNRQDEFEEARHAINAHLAFAGIEYRANGKFYSIAVAETIDEAHKRVNTINAKFKGRRIHGEVSKYCKAELLQDNYFHAVFEATKGLAQRIRDMSGETLDGAALVDKVFPITDIQQAQRLGACLIVPPELRDWFDQLAALAVAYLETLDEGEADV